MPPKKKFFNYQEEDVFKAIDEISKGAKIRETCRKYNIPHTTVINKMKLKYPVQRKMGPPTILTKEEEPLLKSWIIAMAKKGFPVNKYMIVDTVKKIIIEENRPNPFKENTSGRKWFFGFLKRHPDIANVPLIVHKSLEVTDKPKKGDYVIVKYEGECFPGIVKNIDGDLYEISTMTFSAGNTFRWQEQSDEDPSSDLG